MRAWFAILAVAAIAGCLCAVGCKKLPEPAPVASAPSVEPQPAPEPVEDEVAVMTPLDGSAPEAGESEPAKELLEAAAEPLKTETGEEITLFGPLGPALLKLIGAGDASIDGSNEGGVIAAKPGGEEMEISYNSAEHTAKSLGFEEPKSLERSSGFVLEGLVPEKVVRDYLKSMATGESESEITVTELDRRVAIDAAVYLGKGKPIEIGSDLTGDDTSKYISVPFGESAVVCLPSDPAKTTLFIVAAVPESDEVQVTYLDLREMPKPLQAQVLMMRMGASMQSGSDRSSGPGATKTGTKGPRPTKMMKMKSMGTKGPRRPN